MESNNDAVKGPDDVYINGLVQERRNSIANALELHPSCTNPLICVNWIWETTLKLSVMFFLLLLSIGV